MYARAIAAWPSASVLRLLAASPLRFVAAATTAASALGGGRHACDLSRGTGTIHY
jgi:hypothetical protein